MGSGEQPARSHGFNRGRVRWTSGVAVAAGLFGLTGCYYGYQDAYYGSTYSVASRPHGSYFCYDCHGYRFFDPYYDWCAGYGFRYAWSAHPQVVRLYRERYVSIREQHPEYGRYRYTPGYRSLPRYRKDRDYDRWKSGHSGPSERPPGVEGKSKGSAPKENGERKRGRERKEPRDADERQSGRGGWRS